MYGFCRYLPTMQRQFVVMLKTLDNVITFLILLSLFIFIFAIMGMHLFGGRLGNGHDDALRQNFDSFGMSLLTVFQVLTVEEWNILMYHSMHSTSFFAAMYYVILISLGTYILVNLFVAIMVEGFATDPEAIARFKAALVRARAVFQKIAPNNRPTILEIEPADKRRLSVLSEASTEVSSSSNLALQRQGQNSSTARASNSLWRCFNRGNRCVLACYIYRAWQPFLSFLEARFPEPKYPDLPHKRVVLDGATSNPTIRLLLYGDGVYAKKMARMRLQPRLFYFSDLGHVSVDSWVKTMNGLEVSFGGQPSR